MLDVRAIANVILDRAHAQGIEVTNMALNKIAYFVHCDYMVEKGEPLVGAKIEAWQHGPVFREIYHEFKRWADAPIRSRAKKVDPHSGNVEIAKVTFGKEEGGYIDGLIDRYIHFSAGQLRAISHTKGGPWHIVWGHDGQSNPGMKITNELIVEHYSPGVRQ
ncbi:MAG: gepA [Sphingomonas bacterium]|nr:gepA [Sphingomonas bacterium]